MRAPSRETASAWTVVPRSQSMGSETSLASAPTATTASAPERSAVHSHECLSADGATRLLPRCTTVVSMVWEGASEPSPAGSRLATPPLSAVDVTSSVPPTTHAARGENAEELDQLIGKWTAELDGEVIESILNEAGVVVSRIYDVADISRDPHFMARDMLLRVEDPELGEIVVPGLVPKLSKSPGSVRWTGPGRVGAHNEHVYQQLLGHSAEDLEEWRRLGVI